MSSILSQRLKTPPNPALNPKAVRWDLARFAAAPAEDDELATAGLDAWTENLDHEDIG